LLFINELLLSKSSNLFYQKSVKIKRSAPVAAAKKRGQRGKGIAAAASASFSSHKIFRAV